MPKKRSIGGSATKKTRGPTRSKSPQPRQKQAPGRVAIKEVIETREEWLARAASLLFPLVRQVAAWQTIPCRCFAPPAVSCSWPPGRLTSVRSLSLQREDGSWEVLLSPVLGHGQEAHGLPPQADALVLAHLLHELCHCVIGSNSHQKLFPPLAASVGLHAPWSEPWLTKSMREQCRDQVLSRIGSYPHRSMSLPKPKASGNRQRKYVCSNCGRIVRAAGVLRAQHLCDDGKVAEFVLA